MSQGKPSDDPKRRKTRDADFESSTQSLKATDTSRYPGARPLGASLDPAIPNPFGRYRIEDMLGSGAMGVVYLAEDTQLGRKVALKIPRSAALQDAESLERFYREARTTATLRHNNICQVYDVGELGGVHFLSMEYVEGKTIGSYISTSKPPAPKKIALLFRKIALAFQEAHAKGIVHRDLKPSNVMLDAKGEPKVMDFGLARQMNTADQARITQSGTILGTPAYMAPEQVRGELEHIGPRTDIYALGVMLYQFLTGELPFSGPVYSVFAKVLTEQPKPPSQLRPDVDSALETLCSRMMAKDPNQRPASMRDVADMLSAYIKHGPSLGLSPSETLKTPSAGAASMPLGTIEASPQTNGATANRSSSRMKWLAAGTLCAAAVIIGVAVFFLPGEKPSDQTISQVEPTTKEEPKAAEPSIAPPAENVRDQTREPVREPVAPPAGDPKVAARLQLNSHWEGTQTIPNSAGETSVDAVTAKVTHRDWKKFTIEVVSPDRIKRRFHGDFDQVGQVQIARLTSVSPEYAGVVGRTSLDTSAITLSGDKLKLEWTSPTNKGPQKMAIVLKPAAGHEELAQHESADVPEGDNQTLPPDPDDEPAVDSETAADDSDRPIESLRDTVIRAKLKPQQYPASVRRDLIRVVKSFGEKCAKHRETLLLDFAKQDKRLRAQTPQQLAAIETLVTERSRFENQGWLPLSITMRPDAFEYVDRIKKEYDLLTIGYNAAISKLLREKKDAEAKLVEQDLPRHALVFGRWQCEFNNSGKKERFLIELYSNGAVRDLQATQGVKSRRWEKQVHAQLGMGLAVSHEVDPAALNRFAYGYNQQSVSGQNIAVVWMFEDDGESFVAYSKPTQPEYTGTLSMADK